MRVPTLDQIDPAISQGTCVVRADGTVVGYVRRSSATAIATTTRGGSAPTLRSTGVWNLGGCPSMTLRASVPLQAA